MIVDLLGKILPNNIKLILKDWVVDRFYSYKFKTNFVKKVQKKRSDYDKLIFLIATPQHSNLGDHAIVYAELKLLEDIGLAKRVIEISNIDYLNNKEFVREYISVGDLLIIDGGGNMGTLWPMEDDKITQIIETYYSNAIIVFPQTCFYASNIESSKRLLRNQSVYKRANKLVIALRDQRSYEFCMNNFFGPRFICIPDIVLYINDWKCTSIEERKGVLLCFRSDLEKVTSDIEISRIKQRLNQNEIAYSEVSTLANKSVSQKQRTIELFKKWNEFGSARLVITDRLHGMIFAIITGTPCLAIDNISRKVSGVYNLIPKMNNVKICTNIDDVLIHIEGYYYTALEKDLNEIWRKKEYQVLKDIIINEINYG